MELHDIEQPNTAVMPEQEQLIKSTTETIGNFLPKTLLHVTVVFSTTAGWGLFEDIQPTETVILTSLSVIEFIACKNVIWLDVSM